MNKQIIYPSFITRLFTVIVDSIILAFTSALLIQGAMYLVAFINKVGSPKELTNIFTKDDFVKIGIMINIFQFLLFCFYVLGSWFYFSATPAKLMLRIEILNQNTLTKPSKISFLLRFVGLMLYPISIVFIIFSRKKQALHDFMAKTVVISK